MRADLYKPTAAVATGGGVTYSYPSISAPTLVSIPCFNFKRDSKDVFEDFGALPGATSDNLVEFHFPVGTTVDEAWYIRDTTPNCATNGEMFKVVGNPVTETNQGRRVAGHVRVVAIKQAKPEVR
jgi:hypothetical protein